MPDLTLPDFLLARIAEDESEARMWAEREVRWPSWRALADCEAKRRIVELAESVTDMHYEWETVEALLALPYTDHPDYRQEWKPHA